MIGMAFAKASWLGGVIAAAYSSAVDAAWATPLNTFLLLLTLVVGGFLNRKVSKVEKKAEDIHENTTHAANAAASAAAAAADSARIAKELGGQWRSVEVPRPPATGATGATDMGGVE